MRKYLAQLKDGILKQNPTFVQFLGMCPTLAVTTSATNGIGMGLATTAVLICSNILISLLRKFIPKEIRIASYIVIISGFVTAVELLLHAYVQSLYDSLGLYIPLIVVNCIILARAEAYASKNPVLPSAVDGLAMGLGFTLSLTVIGSVRELLGAGSLFGLPVLGDAYDPAIIFILPAGAFLTLGMLSALVNFVRNYAEEHPRKPLSKIEKAVLIADAEVYSDSDTEIPQNHATTEIPHVEYRAAIKEMQEAEEEALAVEEALMVIKETSEALEASIVKNAEDAIPVSDESTEDAISADTFDTRIIKAIETNDQDAPPITVEIPAEAEETSVVEKSTEEREPAVAETAKNTDTEKTEGEEASDHE